MVRLGTRQRTVRPPAHMSDYSIDGTYRSPPELYPVLDSEELERPRFTKEKSAKVRILPTLWRFL